MLDNLNLVYFSIPFKRIVNIIKIMEELELQKEKIQNKIEKIL